MKRKKVLILTFVGVFLIILIITSIILFCKKDDNKNNENDNNNIFVGKWIYDGDIIQKIIDKKDGNLVTDTKILKYIEIYNDKTYKMYYEEQVESGTYSINKDKIILADKTRLIIDLCSIKGDDLICENLLSFHKDK